MKKSITIKTSRKILSIILTVLFGASVLAALFSFVFNSTLSSKNFLEKHLITDSLVTECEKQLDESFAVLSAESGIPVTVFTTAYKEFPTKDSMIQAAQYIFNEQDSTLYSQTKIDYFDKLCKEYLDGNNIKYKKSDISNVAQKAAEIYSNCVGIHNVDYVSAQLPILSKSCGKAATLSVIMCAVIGLFMIIMYSDKNRAFAYLASGSAGAGTAGIFSSVLLILTKLGSHFNCTPAIYQQSVYSIIRLSFLILLVSSVVVAIFSYIILFAIKKKQDKNSTFD